MSVNQKTYKRKGIATRNGANCKIVVTMGTDPEKVKAFAAACVMRLNEPTPPLEGVKAASK